MTREDFEATLRGDGYGIGVPAGIGPAQDRERAAGLVCGGCGRQGLDFLPFIRPGSYRPAYACPRNSCGRVAERG